MSNLFRTRQPFLQLNAWQNQRINALQYQTAQQGSVVPLIIGTIRQQANVIDLGGYTGPQGNGKGVGSLPIGGTPNANTAGGKGFGGGGKGSKKGGNQDYKIDVAYAFAEGGAGVTILPTASVWASASVASFSALPLNLYAGANGQASDPVFAGLGHDIGYSGTLVVTATPLDLGPSPALPNLGAEVTGAKAGTAGPNFPADAGAGDAVTYVLTDSQRGANFPAANLDVLTAGSGTSYGDYCQAAGLAVSFALDGQMRMAEWAAGFAKLTNTAIVWSGDLLKLIPYGDVALNGNGAAWTPNLVPVYSLTDDHFLPWHEKPDGSGPEEGQEDPILLTRTSPARASNWVTIEYLDRSNAYTSTPLPVYDQGAIDRYGRRGGDSLPGKAFCNQTSAQVSAQIHLQREQYVRNTYKFKLGWAFALLEPMDIVLLTGRAGDLYLVEQPVRITAIDEDPQGALTLEAEEIAIGAAATPAPVPCLSPFLDGHAHAAADYLSAAASLQLTLTTTLAQDVIFVAVAIGSFTDISDGPIDVAVDSVSGAGLTWHKRKAQSVTGRVCGSVSTCPIRTLDLEVWWAAAPSPLAAATITVNFTDIADGAAAVAFGMAGTAHYTTPFDGTAAAHSYGSSTPVATALTVSGVTTANPCDTILAFCADMNAWTGIGLVVNQASGPPSYTFVDHAYAPGDNKPAPNEGGWYPSVGVWFLPVARVQSPIPVGTLQSFAPYGWVSIGDAIAAP
jgi:hypothetical protein